MDLVEHDPYYHKMNEDAFDVVIKYTNSKELVSLKLYDVDGGKKDVCKAITDLMQDSREEGIAFAKIETAKRLLGLLADDVIAEKIGLSLDVVNAMHN